MIKALLLRQQSQYFLTLPVALGIGISTYFGLRSEPAWWVAALLLCSIAELICLALVRIAPRALILLAMMLIGFSVAWFNAETSGAPKLNWRYYGPISGIVVKVDRSQSDKTRITLAQVYLSRFDQSKTPKYLRVALHGLADFRTYSIGEHVALTGHLQARQGPVEPGGYDFRRRAWFDQLGGVGYTRSPAVLIAKPAYGSISQYIDRIRQDLARHLRQNLSEHGDFAAAILVGDRSQLDQLAVDSLRRSNLAHLLAISGLHMAIVTGTIFAGLRLAIAAIPYIALRINSKKLAATYAIAAGFIYLFLSGANVPAARAFIMVAVMYTAMLLDRRAISLRSVAISAIIILLLRPQELLEPGFQMSFAATTALVTVFVSLSRTRLLRFNPIGSFILTLMLSSFVAGAATAPFSAFHFNQFSNFGLLANILSVPLIGAVVMPGLLTGLAFDVIGLGSVFFWAADQGIGWILFVAGCVSGLPGVVTPVVKPETGVFLIASIGFVWVFIAVGGARYVGAIAFLVGLWGWSQTSRPEILVASGTGLVGVMSDRGRALSKPKGDGFAARVWLENDADIVDQPAGAERWQQLQLPDGIQFFAGSEIEGNCVLGGIVIAPKSENTKLSGDCILTDKHWLKREGATAISTKNGQLRISTARSVTGDRLWAR